MCTPPPNKEITMIKGKQNIEGIEMQINIELNQGYESKLAYVQQQTDQQDI